MLKTKKLASIGGLLFLALCITATYSEAQKGGKAGRKASAKPSAGSDRILALLDAQVEAWNSGDLDKFMRGYWKSPELTFFSSGGKLNGWDATIERYRKTYQSDGKEMGRLVFDDLDITMLGPDAAFVRGKWELTFSDGKRAGGIYTLVFRRLGNEWKIIHDHTSSVEQKQ